MDLKRWFRGKRARLMQGLAAGCVGILVSCLLFLPGFLERWEAKTWDWRVNLLARPSAETPKIRLILLDQNSLDWARTENGLSWPWPREVYAPIIQFCKRAGARSLAFDVLFTEPSKYGVADDQALASEIRRFPYFISAVFLSQKEGSEKRWPSFAPVPAWTIDGLPAWLNDSRHDVFARAAFPIAEIAAASRVLANVHLNPDADSVYRRTALFEVFDGKVLPSLALASYLSAAPAASLKIIPERFLPGGRAVPIDAAGRAILNFRGPSGTHKAYSAASIIQSELRLQSGEAPSVSVNDFKNAYVLFGFSAPGLYDLRPTPVSGVYPGVEISATMLDNLLADDFIRAVPRMPAILIALLIVLLAGAATSWAAGIFRSALVYVFFIGVPLVLCLVGYRFGFWLPLVMPEVGVVVTLFTSGLIYYTTEGRQKVFIKNAFKQYLSPDVIEQIIAHPDRLKLGGERKMLSIFFSDLEGFTGISEGLDPEALTHLLNVYLTAMTDIIHEEGGTVDKYEGDAIIAFWNAPIEQPDHAARCVRAVLRCQEKLADMRPSLREKLGKDLKMRIGVNTGFAVVGNMGSHSRFDYTMIGDAVNLAARLEGINKQFGTYSLISQSTMEHMAGVFPVREVSRVAVVGRREPVVVYEPLPPQAVDAAGQRRMKDFAAALALFYAGDFLRAKAGFSELADDDPVARAYVAKCDDLLAHPPENWQGVWVVTQK
ncbi:MAG: adenylate/guanylate cyclase domain-containing protein [Deltaproteobacteria bacterium]|nr:adenylate/guanylate cyclase domain-containing protein [Deltaproteobacteria bacterium]